MSGGLTIGRAQSRCVFAAVLSAFSFAACDAQAQLTGGQVVAGQAAISNPTATSTLIRQSTPKAIINWTSFSIPKGSSVAFQQPSASAIALNRVTGGSISQIYGSLTANGQVWLSNPNGIVLGPGAQVSAAGVLLSTMGIHDQDFLSGNYNFGIPGNPGAAILNQGRIIAADGTVILAAEQVQNSGVIEADLGTVVLAGAKTLTVDFAGDDLLKFAVPTSAVDTVAPGAQALVSNSGTIAAPGGRVLLTAAAAKGVLDNVINTSGIVEATSVASVNGKIVLTASGGAAEVSGTLDASGKGAGQAGGTIDVLGDAVRVASGAKLDAAGDAGGGTVLVGGNFHGAGPEQNAQTTIVEAGSLIDASALTDGNGGQVAVWSDGSTFFAGDIFARGGAQGGNGGSVETSGHQTLSIGDGAVVDTRAPRGTSGSWLLDPVEIDIVTGSGSGTIVNSFGTDTVITSQTPGGPSSVSNVTIDNALQNGNVIVQTSSGDISVDADIFPNNTVPAGSAGPTNGSLALLSAANINLNANIDFSRASGPTDTGSLYLQAAGAITYSSGTLTLAGGGLSLQAGTGIGSASAPVVFAGGAIGANTTSGGIFLKSTGEIDVVSVGSLFASGPGIFVAAPVGITATSGDITVDAQTNDIVIGDGAQFQTLAIGTQSGTVTVKGANLTLIAGAPSEGAAGAQIGGFGGAVGDIVVSMTGAVTLNGNSGLSSGAYAQIGHGGPFDSTGSSGNISVTAGSDITLNAGDGDGAYVQIGHGGSSFVGDQGGNITVTAGGGISLIGGAGTGAYAQIGHGGYLSVGANSGAISVSAAGGLTLAGGVASAAYAQIGHGGAQSQSSNSANIAVSAATLSMQGGTGGQAYAQIGQGGYASSIDPAASDNAAVTVAVTGGNALIAGGSGGSGSSDYAMIGDGDPLAQTQGSLIGGDIRLTVSGTTTLTTTADGPAFIGNGSASSTPFGQLFLTSGAFASTGGALENSIQAALGNVPAVGLPFNTVDVVSTGSGALTLGSPISYASGNLLQLQASSGSVVLGSSIDTSGPGEIIISASRTVLGSSLATAGGIVQISGPVTVAANATIDTTHANLVPGGAAIDISGTIDGASAGGQALALNAGTSNFQPFAAIGGAVPLSAITVNGGNISLTGAAMTSGAQGYVASGAFSAPNVQLSASSLTISGSGSVTLGGTISTSDPRLGLVVSGASITLNGGTITSIGPQTYAGPVALNGSTTLTGNGNALTFSGSINGPGALSIDPFSSVVIVGDVGTTVPLSSFSVTAGVIAIGGSVVTTGAQTYSDSTLTLDFAGNPVAVYQTTGGAFTQAGSTFLGGSGGTTPSIVIDTTGNGAFPPGAPITFTTPGDINGAVALTFSAGSGGAISVGAFGSSLVSLNVLSGASFVFTPPAPSSFTCSICAAPPAPVVVVDSTDTTVQQQIQPEILITTGLLELEIPTLTLGFSPPPPLFVSLIGPGFGFDLSSGGGESGGLTSVVQLDVGSQLFTEISPNSGNGGSSEPPDPLTIIPPIQPATQPVPSPLVADEPVGGIGSTLFRSRNFVPNLPGVPGVDQPALGSGNRGLWFPAPNTSP